MNQMTPPPKDRDHSLERAVLRSAALVAERLLRRAAVDDGPTPLSAEQGAAVMQGPAGDGDDGEAPWHDQTMPIADRMKLAEGRPMRRRMMAAMAQQDCGQCGYNCHDYSEAIASKAEARLNLCVPGGKETARMLKSLHEELEKAPAAAPGRRLAPVAAAPAVAAEPGRSRDNPVAGDIPVAPPAQQARIGKGNLAHRFRSLPAAASTMSSATPSAFFARNDLGHVDQIIALLGASHTTEVSGKTLREVLTDEVSLAPAPDSLFELISFITGGAQREKARALAQGDDPDGDAATLDVMAALQKFSGVRPHPEAFVEALEPLQPRLYSISSSHNATPGKLSLTVDCVRYVVGKRKRLGWPRPSWPNASSPAMRCKVYVQKAHGFALPQDPKVPIIMIGPGTGIAPFRAFLLDRKATGAPGKNWLFFGHQRSDLRFLLCRRTERHEDLGLLTRLSLAWSRDGDKKFYVQDRMREVGRELWTWLAEGANVYVCGDAKRMAKDVERALVDIVAQFGARTTDEAVSFVGELKKKGRFQQDVY